MLDAKDSPSTRPYLIRALFEWCTDNGFTPYVAVMVDDSVRVPMEYVKDGEIVLNISYDATSALKLGNEHIEFKARFAGVAREIVVPLSRVIAIYARENGQGMAFPVGQAGVSANEAGAQGKPRGKSGDASDSRPAALLASVKSTGLSGAGGAETGNVVALNPGLELAADSASASGAGSVAVDPAGVSGGSPDGDPPSPPAPIGGRPALKRIK
jgi:stringent starvation protein B